MVALNENTQKIIAEFRKSDNDTGSSEVQIIVLTQRIHDLTEHLKKNIHDFSCKHGLLKLVCRRRAFLRYLYNNDAATYVRLSERLGVKK